MTEERDLPGSSKLRLLIVRHTSGGNLPPQSNPSLSIFSRIFTRIGSIGKNMMHSLTETMIKANLPIELPQMLLPLPSSNVLANYEVVEMLGRGTYGKVELVRYPGSLDRFALKTVRKNKIVKKKDLEHIRNEKEILQSFSSPFLVKLFSTFQDDRCLYFLLEYCPGGDLYTRIRMEEWFPNDVALFYATELLCALKDLHKEGVLFRDLKPENIALDSNGHVKLIDFGLAKSITERTYTLAGTLEYSAPEVLSKQGHDWTADCWSFGVVVYEMLTGQHPFSAQSPMALYSQIVSGQFDIPHFLSKSAASFLSRLLTVDPSARLGAEGIDAVTRHRWFLGVDFNQVERKLIPAPWVPVGRERNIDIQHSRTPCVFNECVHVTPVSQVDFRFF